MNPNNFSEAFVSFFTAVYVDLPFAAAQLWLTGDGAPLSAAGRTAYDAAIDLANEWADGLFRNAAFARFFGVAFETSALMEYLLEGNSVIDARPISPYVEFLGAPVYTNGHDRTATALHPPLDWTGAPRQRRPLSH